MSKQPQKLFLNIKKKSSNHFCTHHLSVGFLVQLPTITCALSASCALRTRVLGLESTDRASHSHSHFAFPQIGKSTIAAGSAVALTVPLVPLLFVSSIVLTGSRPVHFPICPVTYGRRHSPVVFPLSCVLRALLRFFDVGSFCAARGNFPRLRRLPARQWSYHCTGRSSSTCWAMRGIIFVRFAGGHPFPLQSSLPCDVSRLALVWRREKLSSGPVPRANAAGSAARALSSAHLVEPRHAHRF